MFKIQTLNKISELGLSNLPKERFTVSSDIADPDGIVLRSASMHEMELPKSLLAVARAGAGVNNIPIDRCSEKGIVVFNTPGANANAVKEIVIASLLISSRKITQGVAWAQSLNGQTGVAALVEKGKAEFVGPEIAGKKLGVIGLGAIGVLVANAAVSLGMEVMGYDPFLSVDAAWKISRAVIKAPSVDAILEQCDYITIHVPYSNDTKGMLNEVALSKAKPGVRILNFSRGELVDNKAVVSAVKSGQVGCYVTDFPTEELLGIENIVTIPHLGASTPESEENCATMAVSQIRDYLENGNIKNSVNFPNCELPGIAKRRICVMHQNIPGIIGPITTAIAGKNINIDNMINKSKGNYAYTLIDVDRSELGGVEAELMSLSGVISVRVI